MENSYVEFLISKLATFRDPISMSEISTEMLCYPVSFLNSEQLKSLETEMNHDPEEDQLTGTSLAHDLPKEESANYHHPNITDGAAHILLNKVREPLVTLLGMPKIGKSSLLRKIALMAAQERLSCPEKPVPVLVDLKKALAPDISSKMEFVEACLSQYEEFEAFLREELFQGRLILLLDGLDSIGCLKYRLAEWIKALRNFVSLPLCVCAGRFSGFIEIGSVARVELFPLKLQISMAQNMLSELQLERFVDYITAEESKFYECASTPFLFSVLVELFRWGVIGTGENTCRAKLYILAIRHLLGKQGTLDTLKLLEQLASDLFMRETKDFTVLDIKRMGLEENWVSISDLPVFIKFSNEPGKVSFVCSDSGICKENEEENFREPSIAGIRGKSQVDTTPQRFSNSTESFLAYQLARSFIEKDTEQTQFYRFAHLRFQEVLCAQYYYSQIEDSLSQFAGTFVMESTAFQKVFSQVLPVNFFYSRKYREVLLLLGSMCTESIFENLVKFLLSSYCLENCHLAERLIKERGDLKNYRPLINKLRQIKQEICKKEFSKGFWHPSNTVRRICWSEALSNGITENELHLIIQKNLEKVIKTHWFNLKQLSLIFSESGNKALRLILNKLQEVTSEALNLASRNQPYNSMTQNVYLSLLIGMFEKPELPQSTNSSYASPASSPQVDFTQCEEATIKISFDRTRLKSNSVLPQQLVSNKLINNLLESLYTLKGADVFLIVKGLILLGCGMSQIHSNLAKGFLMLGDKCDRKGVLRVLRDLGFVTQHTVDIPLLCLSESQPIKDQAKEILRLLNVAKLKKYSMNVLQKDEVKPAKAVLALRALGFAVRFELDEEVVHFLVQFIDHHDLSYRLEALQSLNKLLKFTASSKQSPLVRRALATSPHLLKDRLRLSQYQKTLKSLTLKCLVSLWVALDKGETELYYNEMQHILVEEALGTSFLVGTAEGMVSYIKPFILSSDSGEKTTGWKCLLHMKPLEEIESETWNQLLDWIKKAIFEDWTAYKIYALKIVEASDPQPSLKNELLEPLLEIIYNSTKEEVEWIAKILYKWKAVNSLKQKLPSISEPYLNISTISTLVQTIEKKIEMDFCYVTEISDSPEEQDRLLDFKQLSNQYKSLVNHLAEYLHCPAKSSHFYKNEFLDISADPSFYKEESVNESFLDIEEHYSSAIEDPGIHEIYELLKAGVRSDALRYWVIHYIKKSELLEELKLAAESWSILNPTMPFCFAQMESSLLKYSPKDTAEIVQRLNISSDKLSLYFLKSLASGDLEPELAGPVLMQCLELQSSAPLEELCKLLNFYEDRGVQKCASRVLECLRLKEDTQLNSCIQALSSTHCGVFIQPIWEYWITKLIENPSYIIPFKSQIVLENTQNWDTRFLLRWARILGILKVEFCANESTTSLPTRKM